MFNDTFENTFISFILLLFGYLKTVVYGDDGLFAYSILPIYRQYDTLRLYWQRPNLWDHAMYVGLLAGLIFPPKLGHEAEELCACDR